jgi:repressor LexA
MSKSLPKSLTLKEKEVLEFIEMFVGKQGIAPSYQEIRKHFGFASFNSVQRYLKQLQSKNYVHLPGDNQKRAIQLLHPSTSYANLLKITSVTTTRPQTNQTKKKEILPRDPSSPPQAESLSLPLLGRVAAGAPIEAFLNEEFIDIPASLVRYPTKTFGLVVQGESMIEDGIFNGDYIFVQKQTYANNGDTIVATLDNRATVKKFYLHATAEGRADIRSKSAKQKHIHTNPQSDAHFSSDGPSAGHRPGQHMVELRPANAQMKSLWVEPDQVSIQGIMVALLRRF